jgi:hypothetical protein
MSFTGVPAKGHSVAVVSIGVGAHILCRTVYKMSSRFFFLSQFTVGNLPWKPYVQVEREKMIYQL